MEKLFHVRYFVGKVTRTSLRRRQLISMNHSGAENFAEVRAPTHRPLELSLERPENSLIGALAILEHSFGKTAPTKQV